jgi:phosphodiesterase/alkaline phosphatase D-like protein
MNPRHLAEWLRRAAPPELPPSQRRRTLLRMASALAASALTAPLASCATRITPRFTTDPFTLGVASG